MFVHSQEKSQPIIVNHNEVYLDPQYINENLNNTSKLPNIVPRSYVSSRLVSPAHQTKRNNSMLIQEDTESPGKRSSTIKPLKSTKAIKHSPS